MTDEAVEHAPIESAIGPPPRILIPRQLDPVAPVFFMSHANVYDLKDGGEGADEPNTLFSTFFSDLSQDLNQLVARRTGADPGFIDRDKLRAGSPWEPDILQAIGTCQVLIALVSASFSKSKWCGKEWDAFTRRRTWSRKDGALMPNPKCAVPVLWTVGQQEDYPQIVMKHHQFRPRPTLKLPLDKLYLAEGVYGLHQIEQEAYRATVWRLAQEIEHRVSEYWVEPSIPADSNSLTDVFAEEEL